MTSASVAHGTTRRNTYVPAAPLREYDQGKVLYYQGRPLSACPTDPMAQGWLDAEHDSVISDIMREARTAGGF